MTESLNRKHLADIIVRKLQLRKGDHVQFFRDRQTDGILIVKAPQQDSKNRESGEGAAPADPKTRAEPPTSQKETQRNGS